MLVIRRVIEAIASDLVSFRALAEQWHEHERAKGAANDSLARRWGSLSSLVTAIGKQTARARSVPPPTLGPHPRDEPRELTRRDVAALVARCSDARAWEDAIVIGLLGERGKSEQTICDYRVHELRALTCSRDVRAAIVEHTRRMAPAAWAFGGRALGKPCSPRKLRKICERYGTTAATLRRAAAGS